MNSDCLEKLFQKKTISFAAWGSTIDDLSIFTKENIKRNFNKKYIFVSLNPSGPIDKQYANFHNSNQKHNDIKLMLAFSNTPLEWMLMLDMSSIMDPNSHNIYVSNDDIVSLLNVIHNCYDSAPTIVVANKKAYKKLKNVIEQKQMINLEIIYIFGYSGSANGAVAKYYRDHCLGLENETINNKYVKVVHHQLGLKI